MKKIVLRKSGQDWTDEFGNTWTLTDEKKQSKIKPWTKEEEDLLRDHLRSGGGFSWESTRKLATALGRTVVAVRGRLTKIRGEEKEER